MSIQKSKRTLLEEISDLMHREHYSLSTERTYCDWIRKFVKFHQMQTREALFVEQEKKLRIFSTIWQSKGMLRFQHKIKPLMPWYFSINECLNLRFKI